MFGYVTFNVKYYILSQIFYKKNRVYVIFETSMSHCEVHKSHRKGVCYILLIVMFLPFSGKGQLESTA